VKNVYNDDERCAHQPDNVWRMFLLMLADRAWLITRPSRAEAFRRPNAQPVTTERRVRLCVYVTRIGTQPTCSRRCVLWAVFVQFLLVRRPQWAFHPQHWPQDFTDPSIDKRRLLDPDRLCVSKCSAPNNVCCWIYITQWLFKIA